MFTTVLSKGNFLAALGKVAVFILESALLALHAVILKPVKS